MNDDELDSFAEALQQQTDETKTTMMTKIENYDVNHFAVAVQQQIQKLRENYGLALLCRSKKAKQKLREW